LKSLQHCTIRLKHETYKNKKRLRTCQQSEQGASAYVQ
jgi:hypothetical protein